MKYCLKLCVNSIDLGLSKTYNKFSSRYLQLNATKFNLKSHRDWNDNLAKT